MESKKVISAEEMKKLPIEERERIINNMTDDEINEFLGIKPTSKSIMQKARKHPHESAAQVVRRLRTQAERGALVL